MGEKLIKKHEGSSEIYKSTFSTVAEFILSYCQSYCRNLSAVGILAIVLPSP